MPPRSTTRFAQPSGPGALEDFLDGSTIGTWTLEVTASVALAGTLNTFCVQFLTGCPIERPSIDSCSILNDDALPPIELTFSGIDPDVIDEILILRNGVVVATLDSDATDYLDEDIPGTGRQTYRVVAFDDGLDCGKASSQCESEPLGRFIVCESPDEDLIEGP